jgi:hypothetical protein
MTTITVPRADVTTEDVSGALRQGLGPRYHVLPGNSLDKEPASGPKPDQPDTILVGTGSSRLFRAQVTISRDTGQTTLRITPGGLPGTWAGGLRLINRLRIARKVGQALQAACSLH